MATVDEAVADFIGLRMDETSGRGEIDLNAVDPEHQGQGIGELTYMFAIRRMRGAGMNT